MDVLSEKTDTGCDRIHVVTLVNGDLLEKYNKVITCTCMPMQILSIYSSFPFALLNSVFSCRAMLYFHCSTLTVADGRHPETLVSRPVALVITVPSLTLCSVIPVAPYTQS